MTTNPRIVLKDNNPFNSRARAITAAATTGRNQSYQRLESDLDESQSSKGSLPRELGSLRRRNQYDARD